MLIFAFIWMEIEETVWIIYKGMKIFAKYNISYRIMWNYTKQLLFPFFFIHFANNFEKRKRKKEEKWTLLNCFIVPFARYFPHINFHNFYRLICVRLVCIRCACACAYAVRLDVQVHLIEVNQVKARFYGQILYTMFNKFRNKLCMQQGICVEFRSI